MSHSERVTYFAQTDSRNRRISFGIKAKDRSRHMYVIGKTGMGKSTLLENLAVQDIRNGEGLAFIDPHGKSADLLLDYVPEGRVQDVLYFAPFDMDHPVGFNVMEDVAPDRRHLVVNGLMSTFEKIWEDAWSARMSYILQNTIHALLEYPGATLLDVNRMYTDKKFRTKVVENVEDISVKSFWEDEYSKYTDRYTQEATPAIQNKIGQLAANPVIRNIIGQPKSSFDIRRIMDERQILIVNLSKGKIGESNANLLGSIMINNIYLGAMSRADITEAELAQAPNFYTFVDEFQSFANRSFADILSESRKYKLNLVMAHQYIEQMSEEVRAAVFGNVGTLISFRIGAYDAEVLEKEFAPQFTAEDMVNLGFAQIYLKLMIDGVSSPPFSAQTLPPFESGEDSHREEVIEASRHQFTRPRSEVEQAIRERMAEVPEAAAETQSKTPGSKKDDKNSAQAQGQKDNKASAQPKDRKGGPSGPRPADQNTSSSARKPDAGPRSSSSRSEKASAHSSAQAPARDQSGLRSALASINQRLKQGPGRKTEPGSGSGVDQVKNRASAKETDNRSELRDLLKQQGILRDQPPAAGRETGRQPGSAGQRAAGSGPDKSSAESDSQPSKAGREIPREELEDVLRVEEEPGRKEDKQ